MTTHDQSLSSEVLPAVTWVDTSADGYAAAAMHEQLSALSDAELARRGLSRASLARDVLAACDRASNSAKGNKRTRCRACST